MCTLAAVARTQSAMRCVNRPLVGKAPTTDHRRQTTDIGAVDALIATECESKCLFGLWLAIMVHRCGRFE
jgi:hypothetical protein